MKVAANRPVQEPMGIVIAVNPSAEQPTVFSAYVWGPAPEDAPTKAA